MLPVIASIYTGAVRAYDVVTMLQRDGHPTALGEALAAYGRILKTLHILAYIDADETYRRDIQHIVTSRKAATTWPVPSATARRENCSTITNAVWKTSSASSAWSSTLWCCGPPSTPGLPAPGRRRSPAEPVRPQAPGGARNLFPLPCPTWNPAPSASFATPRPRGGRRLSR